MSFGAGVARNRSTSAVTVEKVELVDPVGMELIGTRLTFHPVNEPSTTMGAVDGWPPSWFGEPAFRSQFEQAGPIKGSVIPPSDDMEAAFTIGVKADPGAHSDGIAITYSSDGKQAVWKGTIAFRVTREETC